MVWLVGVRYGQARQLGRGRFGFGQACYGSAAEVWSGTARRGKVRYVEVLRGSQGWAVRVSVWSVALWQLGFDKVRFVEVSCEAVRLGLAVLVC